MRELENFQGERGVWGVGGKVFVNEGEGSNSEFERTQSMHLPHLCSGPS